MLAGCTTAKVDWSGRVGVYTFDQAVIELGPPDKQAKLEDGRTVADWLTQRGYTYRTPNYYPYAWGGPFYPDYEISTTPDYYLRLVFGPDGKLRLWKKFAK